MNEYEFLKKQVDEIMARKRQTFLDNQLQQAFDKAEQETAEHFNGQACSVQTKDGEETCPICYFRQRVKAHLSEMNFYMEVNRGAENG